MKTTREFASSDRYAYDFGPCNYKKGWAQLDTWQDAPYFGVWINPARLTIFTYCEGDTILQECETTEEFTAEIRRIMDFYSNDDKPAKIDGMCNDSIISAFTAMGMVEQLH